MTELYKSIAICNNKIQIETELERVKPKIIEFIINIPAKSYFSYTACYRYISVVFVVCWDNTALVEYCKMHVPPFTHTHTPHHTFKHFQLILLKKIPIHIDWMILISANRIFCSLIIAKIKQMYSLVFEFVHVLKYKKLLIRWPVGSSLLYVLLRIFNHFICVANV